MGRGTWRAAVHGVTKSQTRLKRLTKDVCTKETRSLGRAISSSVHFLYPTQNMEWTEHPGKIVTRHTEVQKRN